MSRRQRVMDRKQRGLSMVTFLLVAVVLIFGALIFMKVGPAYKEYFEVKRAVTATAADSRNSSVAEVRRSFERRAIVDSIDVIGAADLDISKEGNEVVVSFSYTKKVPLFGNVSLLFEFSGSSNR